MTWIRGRPLHIVNAIVRNLNDLSECNGEHWGHKQGSSHICSGSVVDQRGAIKAQGLDVAII